MNGSIYMSKSGSIYLSAIALSPFVNYTFVFLDAVNDEDEFWFGVSLIF
jgi:hypothetical protein